MPVVRQRDVGVGQRLPVLPVPPRLVHRDVQAPVAWAKMRRRQRMRGRNTGGRGVGGALSLAAAAEETHRLLGFAVTDEEAKGVVGGQMWTEVDEAGLRRTRA